MKDYVTQIDGVYRITDSRVSLDSVVHAWRDGLSPESIKEHWSNLSTSPRRAKSKLPLCRQQRSVNHST